MKSLTDGGAGSDAVKQRPNPTAETASASDSAAVGRGLKFRGEISGQGDFFYDGEFEGKIHLDDGTFTIGPNARVNAEIEARQIIVRGEVTGALKARESVHISSTAKLTGNMETRGIVIEDGAELHGKVATPRGTAGKDETSEPAIAESSPRAKNAAAGTGGGVDPNPRSQEP